MAGAHILELAIPLLRRPTIDLCLLGVGKG